MSLQTPNNNSLLETVSDQQMFLSSDSRVRSDSLSRLDFWQPRTDSFILQGDLLVFACNRCSFKTNGNQELLTHFYQSHKEVKAENIVKQRTLSTSQSSETVVGQEEFSCGICSLGFISTSALKNHTTRTHGKKFKCKDCNYSCGTKGTMTKHLKIHQ